MDNIRRESADQENYLGQVHAFWNTPIDFENTNLEIDKAPFCVLEETQLSKIHFLFTMLNINQLKVISRGIMIGLITKNDFLKKKAMFDDGYFTFREQ